MEDNYIIRKPNAEDYPNIAKLINEQNQCEVDDSTITRVSERLQTDSKENLFFVYIADDKNEEISNGKCKTIGYILFSKTYSSWVGPTLNLDNLYVDVKHKECIAVKTLLMKAVTQEAHGKGYKKMDKIFARTNHIERSFFEKVGCIYEEEHCVMFFRKDNMKKLTVRPLENYSIREAVKGDCKEILRLIRQLAVYGKDPESRVEITSDMLENDGFGEEKSFKCYVAEHRSNTGELSIVGHAFYYPIYSAMEGAYLKMEDLFVEENHRGNGVGAFLLKTVTQNALHGGYHKIFWYVLAWNEPSRKFYKSIGSDYKEDLGLCYYYEDQIKNFCCSTYGKKY